MKRGDVLLEEDVVTTVRDVMPLLAARNMGSAIQELYLHC